MDVVKFYKKRDKTIWKTSLYHRVRTSKVPKGC